MALKSILNLSPKEAIVACNNEFVRDYLESQGYNFNEKTLEYTKKTQEFKFVIGHRCSRNNIQGVIINFGIYDYFESSGFKRWLNKKFPNEKKFNSGLISGVQSPYDNKQDERFKSSAATFKYSLIKYDIKEQFDEILRNYKEYVIPSFNYFNTFKEIIKCCKEYDENGKLIQSNIMQKALYSLYVGQNAEIDKIKSDIQDKYDIHVVLKERLLTRLKNITEFKSTRQN
jgi:hypothetical protein